GALAQTPVGGSTRQNGAATLWSRPPQRQARCVAVRPPEPLVTEAASSHPSGQPLTNVYDPAGNRMALVGWFGRLTATFDPRRSISGLVDPQGGRSTWTFDALARWTEQDNPNRTA